MLGVRRMIGSLQIEDKTYLCAHNLYSWFIVSDFNAFKEQFIVFCCHCL